MKHLRSFPINEARVNKELLDKITNQPRWEAFEAYIRSITPEDPDEKYIQSNLLYEFSLGREQWDDDIHHDPDDEDFDENGEEVRTSLLSDGELLLNMWNYLMDGWVWGLDNEEAMQNFNDKYIYDSNDTFIPELEDLEFIEEIIIRVEPSIESVINSGSIKNAVDQGITIDYDLLLPLIFELYPPMESKFKIEGANQERMTKLSRASRILARNA